MNIPMTNDRKPLELPPGSTLSEYRWSAEPVSGGGQTSTKVRTRLSPQRENSIQYLPAIALAEEPLASTADLQLLVLPTDEELPAELLNGLQSWTEQSSDPLERRCGLLQLQGCRIFWGPGRAALIAAPRRLEPARAALLEAIGYESRLRTLENWLESGWEQLQSDLEPAFEFSERQLRRRTDLRQRYQEVLGKRAELAQLTPRLHFPPIYPPTLASQIGERVRERTRLVERAEFASQQLEVYERVYEQAGQRRNEFLLQRSSNQLEWIIILLLLAQIVLVLVEMLGGQGVN